MARPYHGICTECNTEPQSKGRNKCLKCGAKYTARRNAERRSRGNCLECGVPAQGKPYCDACRVQRNTCRKVRYHAFKLKCVQLLGGKCLDCGLVSAYSEIYDFHHLDPTKKELGIANAALMAAKAWPKVVLELAKCVLLCANCHRTRHAKEGFVEGI